MSRKPNILYIFTDQQAADAMSCAGNPNLRTPAMDRIAGNGVRFENAYCTYPLCVPSRMSMVTGRMPHELAIFANCHESETPCNCPTLGTVFQQAGYHTEWIGKWHLTIPEGSHDQHGFENIVFGGGYGNKDSRKTEEVIAFLEREHERPFLLVVSYNNPHDCCEWSRGDDLKMEPLPEVTNEEELPPLPVNHAIPDNEPDSLRAFAREYSRTFRAMQWDEHQARRYLWGYHKLVEMVDQEIGGVLDALEETGLDENTLVVFSSDHGDGMARHRWNQKWSLYDESAKVPFIIAGPAVDGKGSCRQELVSAGLDLLPTLCDYAGIEPPPGLIGRSVRALLEDEADDWRDYVGAETVYSMWAKVGEDNWPKVRMIRSQNFKYVCYETGTPREQLTDINKDSRRNDKPRHRCGFHRGIDEAPTVPERVVQRNQRCVHR